MGEAGLTRVRKSLATWRISQDAPPVETGEIPLYRGDIVQKNQFEAEMEESEDSQGFTFGLNDNGDSGGGLKELGKGRR